MNHQVLIGFFPLPDNKQGRKMVTIEQYLGYLDARNLLF